MKPTETWKRCHNEIRDLKSWIERRLADYNKQQDREGFSRVDLKLADLLEELEMEVA